jgi:hypothetical protein
MIKTFRTPFVSSGLKKTSLVTYVHSLGAQPKNFLHSLVVQNVEVFSVFPLLLFGGRWQIIV